jgi:UDP:flavonoid glycosyltransferase YjiC (YdhE family)
MATKEKDQLSQAPAPPQLVLDQAQAAVEGQIDDESRPRSSAAEHHTGHHEHHHGTSPNLDHVPPPAYNGAQYGQLDISQNGMDTGAKIGKDGRVNIKINARSHKLSDLLVPALRRQLDLQKKKEQELPVPEDLAGDEGYPPPPMNIVIQIVGSRGDVQPFIALGQVLKNKYNHRVRIATHPTFREFVTDNGLEFFSIGGDPAELMAFMVKNPGLMPGMDSLKSGDVGKRRKGIYEIVTGCWRSCIEAGDGTGIQASDDYIDTRSFDSRISAFDPTTKPFVADVIIANPPSFAHVHIAEKMGIPLHLMFTMPWSPTQSFSHPLANIVSSNTDPNMANFITYALVDMLTWQGLGDVINRFRERSLGLEPISIMWAPGMASRLRIPWTYCWSPALIPKPADWGHYIDISGFFFLNLASNYTPAPELAAFLEAGPPPVYIGFGSIVVDDPNAMTKMIFDAVKMTGCRALISKGWGGLGADQLGIPEGCFMLGNCPHDWLFKRVSCVVHHGGAGTTAAGISAGRPTVVVPFFGDQPFWGAMCARAGAGPMPIAYKDLTAEKLASQIKEALKPESLSRAKELSEKIAQEKGTEAGADSFHKQLNMADLRCSLCPDRVAVWRVKRTDIRLSTLAATVLGSEGLLDFTDLKLYRPREYETEDGPWEPITGGAAALIGTLGNLSMGVADFPVEILKSLKVAQNDVKEAHEKHKHSPSASGKASPISGSENPSSADLSKTGKSSTPTRSGSVTGSTTTQKTATDPSLADASTAVDTESNRDARTSSALSKVLSPDGEPRSLSRQGSRSSRSGSPRRVYGEEPPCPVEDVAHVTMESALGGAKAAGRIVSAGVKSPMDFTLSLAKGFHNAPKLYGDTTVRKSEKITDLRSGLKAAGKEFGFGFYDGITGLVTQPLAGAQKEGVAGFIKGAAKGIGGVVLKPGAGIWGLPGYTAKGVYAELSKHFGSSVLNYIIAARTAQGYEEWKNSSPEQRADIVSAWKSSKVETRKGGKKYGEERKHEIEEHIVTRTQSNSAQLMSGFKNTRRLTWDERKALAERKQQLKKEEQNLKRQEEQIRAAERKQSRGGKVKSRCKYCPFDHDSDHHLKQTSSFPNMTHSPHYGRSASIDSMQDEFEEAIQKSVTATSRGNPDEDALIERAIRASVKELQQAQSADGKHDDEMYQKAVKASVEEAKKARAEQGGQVIGATTTSTGQHNDDDDEELHRVLTQSLEEYKASNAAPNLPPRTPSSVEQGAHFDDSDSAIDTENDEDFKRTLEESKRLHSENEERRKKIAQMQAQVETPAEDDKDSKSGVTAGMEEGKKQQDEKSKQLTEEEIVLEYVKKQSLLEEEHRKKRAGEGAQEARS